MKVQDPVFKMIKISKKATAEQENKHRSLPLQELCVAPQVTCLRSQLREQSMIGEG